MKEDLSSIGLEPNETTELQMRRIAAEVFDEKLREFANRPDMIEMTRQPLVGGLIAKFRTSMLNYVGAQ